MGFTDERFTGLMEALKSVRAVAWDTLTEEERSTVDLIINDIESGMYKNQFNRPNPPKSAESLIDRTQQLVDSWCDKRNTAALSWIIRGWPITVGSTTEEWKVLLDALQTIRAVRRHTLTEDEQATVERLIIDIDRMLNPQDFKRR